MTTEKDIAQMLTALRESQGLNKREFAEKYNVSKERISQWENVNIPLSQLSISMIADLFGIEVDVVMTLCKCGCGRYFQKQQANNVFYEKDCATKYHNNKPDKKKRVYQSQRSRAKKIVRIKPDVSIYEFEQKARDDNMTYGDRQKAFLLGTVRLG